METSYESTAKVFSVSASKDRADNFTTFTMRLINEMPILADLIPRDDQRNSKVSFDVKPAQADHAPHALQGSLKAKCQEPEQMSNRR